MLFLNGFKCQIVLSGGSYRQMERVQNGLESEDLQERLQ